MEVQEVLMRCVMRVEEWRGRWALVGHWHKSETRTLTSENNMMENPNMNVWYICM